MGTQVISGKGRACHDQIQEAYSEIREQLPYFLGLSAENGFSLLEQAGFSEISRHDHLFHENPMSIIMNFLFYQQLTIAVKNKLLIKL